MVNVSDFSKAELIKHNIDLVENLLKKQGYKLNKMDKAGKRTDYNVSNSGENFNIKILGYRYNEKVKCNYAYVRKNSFDLNKFKYLFFILYIGENAHILKIPSVVFLNPASNSPFKNRDYIGLKSLPEFGIDINNKNLKELLKFEET